LHSGQREYQKRLNNLKKKNNNLFKIKDYKKFAQLVDSLELSTSSDDDEEEDDVNMEKPHLEPGHIFSIKL
jgi:hypothetical protein